MKWPASRLARWGVTIAELLMAIGIFSVVTTALMSVWATHCKAVDQAQNQLAAAAIADGLLAQEAGLAFQAQSHTGETVIKRSMDNVVQDYKYNWEVVVSDTTVASPDIKVVTVFVRWDEQGKPKELKMVTCVYWQG